MLGAEQIPGGSQCVLGLIDYDRLPQDRVRASLQHAGNTLVVAYDSQSQWPFGGLTLASDRQEQRGFRLFVPIDDDDLEVLIGDFFGGDDRVGTGLSFDTEIGQNLANERGCPLVRGEHKAAKSHASS